MGKMTDPIEKAKPLQTPGVPEEEGIETAQVADDLEQAPEDKPNATDGDDG